MKIEKRPQTLAEMIKTQEFEDWVTRPLARTGKTVAKGIAGIGDVANLPVNAARGFMGYEPLQSPSELVGQAFDEYSGGLTKPQNAWERGIDTAGEFITGGGPYKAAAKAAPILNKLAPQSFKDVVGSAAAGAGFQTGREIAPNNPLVPLATSLAPGFAVQAAPRALSSLFSVNPQKAAAFKQADLQPTLSNISNSKPVGTIENLIAEMPFANKALKNIADNTRNAIAKMGHGLTQEEVGTIAQEGLKGYVEKGSKVIEKLKSRVNEQIPADANIKIPNLLNTIKDRPKLFTRERQEAFAKSPIGKKYQEITKTAGASDSYPFNDLNDLRQEIDNAVTTFGQYGSKEQGQLKNLRSQIQNDIRAHLVENNPKALKDFDRYNRVTHQLMKKREDFIDGLLNNKTATETFRKIKSNLNVDAIDAKTVLNTFKPEQKRIFSEGLIRELGMTSQNEFKGTQLSTNFNKLEPLAQDVVLSSFTPKERDKFRGLMGAIDAIKDTQALGNPSRTAYTAALGGIGGALVSGDLASAGMTIAKIATGTTVATTLFSNPKFINWLADAQMLKTPKQFERHIGDLSKIVKNEPSLAPAINHFLEDLSKDSEDDLQSLSTEELKAMLGEDRISTELESLSTEELKAMLEQQ